MHGLLNLEIPWIEKVPAGGQKVAADICALMASHNGIIHRPRPQAGTWHEIF